jgi:hypothetical protein
MEKKTFDIFNMSCPIDQLVDIETKFELLRSMDAYDDTELYVSKETFKHDLDEDLKFDYKYFIEAYHYTEEGENRTYYTLYLVPMFNSLADKRKNDVAENAGDPENATAEDVFDYGIQIVMARTNFDGEYDKSIMDKVASVFETIDRLKGFYLDKAQNRLGSTGWDMLDDYINGNDFLKATLDRYDSSK